MATFSEGFAKGIVPGVYLSREMRERGKERKNREIMDWISQAENYDPYEGAFDAGAQAVPEDGQTVQANPNRGFDGRDFEKIQKGFYTAAAGLGDMESFAKAKELWTGAKTSRITGALDGAIAAAKAGDMATAGKMFRTASAFISPGYTPEINVDQAGNVIFANYDEKGNPAGGGAVNIKELESLRDYYNNPDTWANRKQSDEHFNKTEGRMWEQFALTKQDTLARLELAKSEDARAAEKSTWDIVNAKNLARKAELEAFIAEETAQGTIDSTNAQSAAGIATASEEERKASKAKVDEAMAELYTLNKFSVDMQEKINAARGGDVDIPAAMATLIGGESGGRPGAVSSKGAAGLGQIMQTNIVPWAHEVMGQYVAGMSDEQILQLYREDDDFQNQLATAKFTQILQGEAGGRLEDAFSIWHSGDPLAEARARNANDIVDGKGMYTVDYVEKMMSAYNARTGGKGGAGSAVATAVPEPGTDLLGAGEEDEKPKEERFDYASWLWEQPNELGERLPREGMDAMTRSLMEDLNRLNPDESTSSLAHMANGAFSPADQSTKVLAPDEEGRIYLSNGVDKMEVSEDGAGLIEDYRHSEAQALLTAQPGAMTEPEAQQFGGAFPLPPEEEFKRFKGPSPVITSERSGVPEEEAPASMMAPSVPGAPREPGSLAADAAPALLTPPSAAAINPYATPEMSGAPPVLDDTAAGIPAASPAEQAAPILVRNPQLAAAVQAWKNAGGQTRGPEMQALSLVLEKLSPAEREQAIREIRAMMSGGQ